MTGIERLRRLARSQNMDNVWTAMLAHELCDIADQIERERACDSDTAENIRLIVGGVIDDMERHCLGHEGADDSPVARWARELRRALKSYTSDAAEQQNPSCADPAETAGVTSDAQKVTRDPAEDVSMSAYDLLPQEEREAIAWVRGHGGLGSVKKLLGWVVKHLSTERQLDFDFWLSGRVMYELGFDEDMADRDEVERRLLARLMPEGMSWPVFEDNEPVRIGDEFMGKDGKTYTVQQVQFIGKCFSLYDFCDRKAQFNAFYGERVKRPDSWERIEADAGCTATKYNERRGTIFTTKQQVARDLVRRCRALAERERGE